MVDDDLFWLFNNLCNYIDKTIYNCNPTPPSTIHWVVFLLLCIGKSYIPKILIVEIIQTVSIADMMARESSGLSTCTSLTPCQGQGQGANMATTSSFGSACTSQIPCQATSSADGVTACTSLSYCQGGTSKMMPARDGVGGCSVTSGQSIYTTEDSSTSFPVHGNIGLSRF